MILYIIYSWRIFFAFCGENVFLFILFFYFHPYIRFINLINLISLNNRVYSCIYKVSAILVKSQLYIVFHYKGFYGFLHKLTKRYISSGLKCFIKNDFFKNHKLCYHIALKTKPVSWNKLTIS